MSNRVTTWQTVDRRTPSRLQRHASSSTIGVIVAAALCSVVLLLLASGVAVGLYLYATGANLGTPIAFRSDTVYYDPATVTPDQAGRVGDILVSRMIFTDENKVVRLTRSEKTYQLHIPIKKGMHNDMWVVAAMMTLAADISRDVFAGRQCDIHLCDKYFRTIRVVVPSATPQP